MLKKVFESEPVQYREPWAGIPSGIGLQSLYNGWLITPPRIYAEAFGGAGPYVLYTDRQTSASSPVLIHLVAWTVRIYWPSWEIMHYWFDSATGEMIGSEPVPWGAVGAAWTNAVQQGFDGQIYRVILDSMYVMTQDLATSTFLYNAAHFGRIKIDLPVPDPMSDTIVMGSQSGQLKIYLYTMSTGALIREIDVSDAPAAICPERKGRVFVMGTNFLLNLVELDTGRILATWKVPKPANASKVMISWDPIYHKILVFSQVPDATDGACLSTIVGYYPLPVTTGLMKPTPLVPLRKGRTVPVLTRAIGDAGEPVAGPAIKMTATGPVEVPGFGLALAANNGYASHALKCVDAGETTVTMTTEF